MLFSSEHLSVEIREEEYFKEYLISLFTWGGDKMVMAW